jgi:hypothetical protein
MRICGVGLVVVKPRGRVPYIGPNAYQTDYGLRTPNEALFQQYLKLLGQLGR